MEDTHDDEMYHGHPPDIAHKHHYAPGKILCFVEEDKKPLMAVVLCCAFKHVRSGVFPTHWNVETLCFVDGCGGNCLTLLDDPGEQGWTWVPRSMGEGKMG
jgi:hypothetical protein